jgi:hypothetical protein
MLTPLNKVLIKIFAKGFFSVNSGLLLFLFVVLISYCFFIETVGHVGLLPPKELAFYRFIIVRTFISSPLITLIMLLFWLLYAIKSWRYVIRQLSIPNYQFLFYSTTSLSKPQQLLSWFCVQSVIFLPLIGYWVFAMVFGIIFHHYLLPGIILLYILLLTFISAILYTYSLNRLVDGAKQSYILQLMKNWRKPYFSLFIYHVFDRVKLGYLLAQILSILSITLASSLDVQQNVRLAGMVILLVVTAHSFVIYQNHHFEETRLSFSRNLPFSRIKRFANLAYVYLILLLPEYIWLFSSFDVLTAIKSLLLSLSIALLFHSLLYWSGHQMNIYLRCVFFLFFIFFLLILFNVVEVLIPLNFLFAIILFNKHYYQSYTAV